jgi:5'-nucleotidase
MKHYIKRISLILAIVMMFSVQFAFALAAEDTAAGQIVVLHTNDVHSRVDTNIGYASVKGWKDYYEAQGAIVIVLDAGDALHGFPIANLGQGENIVEIMNAVGYTAMAPGNHDFNYGIARLLELEKNMNFDLLSTNITKINGGGALTPSKLYAFDGVKIGIVGISTPETETKTNPVNVRGYTFNSDKIATLVQTQIDKLEDDGADYVIALGHLGIDEESAPYRSTDIIEATHGINLFIDGHSHTALENGQIVKDEEGQDVMLAQTGNYMEAIGKVTIDSGKMSASLIKEAKPDATVAALIAKKNAEIKPMLDTIVAKSNVGLNGERDPGVRTEETNLGDLAADAIKYVSGADIALTNGGGIRVSIPTGDISYGTLNSVFPFGNVVVTLDITGKQLLSALENGTKHCPDASGGFPQVAGIDFEIHTDLTENRVQNVKINGETLDLTKTYSLATNDFTQAGGDGYTMLADCKKTGEYGALDEALVAYIEKGLDGAVGQAYASDKGRITIITAEESPFVEKIIYAPTHWGKNTIGPLGQTLLR